MNAFGSGRYTGAKRAPRRTTEEIPAVDVRELKRTGSIAPGQERVEGLARLQFTPGNFGGSRPWFVCPGCERRVAILYGSNAEGSAEQQQPLCRRCLNLAYPSQREDQLARAKRRMHKARKRLPPDGSKPKRMRHVTFEKRVREYLEARREYAAHYREWLAWASQCW